MATIVTTAGSTAAAEAPVGANRYGRFSPDGSEYCITDWRTPRPWVNVISNPRVGLVVSQTGSGFSWIDNSQLAVLTRWQQEFAQDSSGKFLYVRDADSGRLWSLAPAPTFPAYDRFLCRHGLGYTVFETELEGLRAVWTLFVHPTDTVEYWQVELHNLSDRPRRLELCAYLEWNCGVQPSPRREFHKIFLENDFDAERRAIFARSHMWDVPSKGFGHWNADFPYVSALACTEPVLAAQGDKAAFLGRYGELRTPAALGQDRWKPRFGRHDDAIAALRSTIELRAGGRQALGYALATAADRTQVERTLDTSVNNAAIETALGEARSAWRGLLAEQRVETPDASLNALTNDWVRYQAISGRIWGRAGYYQQSGAYGFRDQLQDSQVWLTIEPQRCRDQLNLHAAHQFADGSVYHWWHPLSEQGHVTKMTDDLLWLSFVAANYIRETGELGVLSDAAPFIDDKAPAPLMEHIWRAFQRSFGRMSPRGLPYLGAGDWNDGLSAAGLQEKGESIWLGHFLAGLLGEWATIFRRLADVVGVNGHGARPPLPSARAGLSGPADAAWRALAADFDERRERLIAAINAHGWDGGWYLRGTLDDGSPFGSRTNLVGRIFLNAQTWALLNNVAPADRSAACWAAVKEHLVTDAGALLLAPAYDAPVREIGYITRYAPGLRENGGVYSHAATWAIAAAAKMRDAALVERLLTAMNPAVKDPERYWAEPYVLPGNVDGPESPYHGRGGWTWYTGSAQWLHRVVTQWVLGVRPEWDGLRIDPVLPPSWKQARMVRPWRGCTYDIRIERVAGIAATELALDGRKLGGNVLPVPESAGRRHKVMARCG